MKFITKLFIVCMMIKSMLHAVHITIITPTYNNENYCLRNIQSVVDQTYEEWNMIIINDCSTDATSRLLHTYVEQQQLTKKTSFVENRTRKGALQNIYETIHQYCSDDAVILTLDGDDWLATTTALDRIARAYDGGTTWLTYGQFIWYPQGMKGFCKPFPPEIMKYKQFRSYYWVSSHPRTFYAWLFKNIQQEDLMHEESFFPMAWDLAMMLPMLEMASDGHITCIEDILYAYNDDNPLNDHKKDLTLQRSLGTLISQKPAYPTLEARTKL